MANWLKLILLIEVLSLTAFLRPTLGAPLFVIICLAVLLASLVDLRYGLYAALAELFIGGQGYLFFFEGQGLHLSIRMAIFIIVISVAVWQILRQRYLALARSRFFLHYLLLFATLILGLLIALRRGLSFPQIFFDINAYLFLAYLVVFYQIGKTKLNWSLLWRLFSVAVAWLSFKTLVVFYIFSHKFPNLTPWLYKWLRDTRVGEITPAAGGFYRIFFQSHIYLVFWIILAIAYFIYKLEKESSWKEMTSSILIFVLAGAALILSFSRSFWLGLLISIFLLLLTVVIYLRFSIREVLWPVGHLAVALVISFSLVAFLAYFPYPEHGNFSLLDLLRQRTTSLNDAAASSRSQLFKPLWSEITKNWLWGAGFGSTVTYKSSDPRILASFPLGLYTTSAFEWGWLDIWLKIGLVGVVAYLFLLKKIWQRGWYLMKIERTRPWLPLGLNFTLLALVIINFFTPYLNHPLGLGWLMLVSAIYEYQSKFSPIKSR